MGDGERVAAGYHACDWLQAQDGAAFDLRQNNQTRDDVAAEVFENTLPHPAANALAAAAAWRQLCRGLGEDKLKASIGGD